MRIFANDIALYLTMENEDDSSALQNDLDRYIVGMREQVGYGIQMSSGTCERLHKDNMTDYVLHGQVLMPKVRKAAYTSLVRPQLEYTSAVDSDITNQTNPAKSCSLDDRQASVTEMVTSVFAYFTR